MDINSDLIFDDEADGEVSGHNSSVEGSEEQSGCENNSADSSSTYSDSASTSSSAFTSSREIAGPGGSKLLARSGGIMSFVRRRAFSAKASCTHSTIVPGRCLETLIVEKITFIHTL